jgi:hypothetical protein
MTTAEGMFQHEFDTTVYFARVDPQGVRGVKRSRAPEHDPHVGGPFGVMLHLTSVAPRWIYSGNGGHRHDGNVTGWTLDRSGAVSGDSPGQRHRSRDSSSLSSVALSAAGWIRRYLRKDDIALGQLAQRPLTAKHALLMRRDKTTMKDLPTDLNGPFAYRAGLRCLAVEDALSVKNSFNCQTTPLGQSFDLSPQHNAAHRFGARLFTCGTWMRQITPDSDVRPTPRHAPGVVLNDRISAARLP